MLTLDRMGVGGVCGRAMNLVTRAAGPPPLYIARRQGPTNQSSVGRPRSGRERKGSIEPLDSIGGDQSNILPLDLNFTFNLILSTLFVSSHIGT